MLGARFRKLSVCIALTANSIRSSISSLFFHGMPRFYLTTPPKSVTYVLNPLCILCPEPAPVGRGALQIFQIVSVIDLKRENPAFAEWISVNQSRVIGQRIVCFHYRAFNRCVNVARGLDRFHHRYRRLCFHARANFG